MVAFWQWLGPEPVVSLVLTGFALLGAVTAAVLASLGRQVPLAARLGGPVLAAVVPCGLAWFALLRAPESAEGTRQGLTTFAVCLLLGVLSVPAVVGSSGLVWSYLGARDSPRRALPATLGALWVVATAAAVVVGGVATNNPMFAYVRGGAYLCVGLALVPALLAGGEGERGEQAALVVGPLFPLVVVAGEVAERGLIHLMMLLAAPSVSPERWPLAVVKFYEAVAPELPYNNLTVALSFGFWGASLWAGWRSPRRGQALALGVLCGLTVLALWSAADAGPDRMAALWGATSR